MSEKLLIRNNGYPFRESVSSEPVTRFVTKVEFGAREYLFPEGEETLVDADVAHYVEHLHGGHGLLIVHPEAEAAVAAEREDREARAAEALAAVPSIATAPGAVPPPLGERADGTAILRQDGPTFEQFVAAGYKPENYPPAGYEEKRSPGLEAYKAEKAEREWKAAAASTPSSVDQPPADTPPAEQPPTPPVEPVPTSPDPATSPEPTAPAAEPTAPAAPPAEPDPVPPTS